MIITFTGTLAWLLYCYQTSGTPLLLNSCTPELLYPLYSCPPTLLLLLISQLDRRPAEHAWCCDDEDVSHNRASVRQILNGNKCHTEQSVTSYTWWGPPLESVGATSRIHSPHRAKYHTEQSATPHTWWEPPLESVGATSWICGATSYINRQSKVPHGAKCHTTHVVGATSWICEGHLLNLWGYFLPPACAAWC